MLRQISNSTSPDGIIDDLNLSQIIESPYPIRTGSREKIDDLAKSIQQNGFLNAILVRIKNERMYEIVAGNRRYNTCKSMGLRKIPCQIVGLDDKDAFELSLIENIQRKNLCPIGEAQTFKKYVSDLAWGGTSELAEKMVKSLSYITRRIKLLDLASDVINYIINSAIYTSAAEELFSIKDNKIQSELAKIISSKKITIKENRELLCNPDASRADNNVDNWMTSSSSISPKDLGERKNEVI